LLQGVSSFSLYKIEAPRDKYTFIEFSNCVGNAQFSVVRDPGNFTNRMPLDKYKVNGADAAHFKEDGEFYILVEAFGW
jgi:hypothetical protein